MGPLTLENSIRIHYLTSSYLLARACAICPHALHLNLSHQLTAFSVYFWWISFLSFYQIEIHQQLDEHCFVLYYSTSMEFSIRILLRCRQVLAVLVYAYRCICTSRVRNLDRWTTLGAFAKNKRLIYNSLTTYTTLHGWNSASESNMRFCII